MVATRPGRDDTDVVGIRVVAQFVDLLLMAVTFVFVVFLLSFTGSFVSGLLGTPGGGLTDLFSGVGILLGGVGSLAYSSVLEALWNGQTVGKRLVGIRVVTEGGDRISAGKAFLRNVPALVSFAWLAYLVALLSMAATDRRQRLFDSIAGTVVVRARWAGGTPDADAPDPRPTPSSTDDR